MEVFYDDNGNETERILLDPSVGNYGCVVPPGVWHSVEVLVPSVIYEAKDGRYSEDGSETFDAFKAKDEADVASSFSNCLGDLKKNIVYLIGMERQAGRTEEITPQYVARVLNVPIDVVERVMREL